MTAAFRALRDKNVRSRLEGFLGIPDGADHIRNDNSATMQLVHAPLRGNAYGANKERRFLLDNDIVVGKSYNGQRTKTSRETMRERVLPLQNSNNPHVKVAALPPCFGAFCLSFGWVELNFS